MVVALLLIIAGVLLSFTGLGAAIGIPMVLIGFAVMIFVGLRSLLGAGPSRQPSSLSIDPTFSSPQRRSMGVAILIAVAAMAAAYAMKAHASEKAHHSCPAEFVAKWKDWKWGPNAMQGAMPQPKSPCLMKTNTGNYLCDKDGCGRTEEH